MIRVQTAPATGIAAKFLVPRKSKADLQNLTKQILKKLHREYPDADCALKFNNPLQLLIATILSAQCTDVRVNKVTPGLFRKYKDVTAFAAASQSEIEEIIRSTGFFRNKAKSICGASKKIVLEYNGIVPRTMKELLSLPGVARKTANVVLGTAFGIADGIVVVGRLSQRLGLSRNKDPKKIENDLMDLVPLIDWIYISHAFIWHGRGPCKARKPNCSACAVETLCPFPKKIY